MYKTSDAMADTKTRIFLKMNRSQFASLIRHGNTQTHTVPLPLYDVCGCVGVAGSITTCAAGVTIAGTGAAYGR